MSVVGWLVVVFPQSVVGWLVFFLGYWLVFFLGHWLVFFLGLWLVGVGSVVGCWCFSCDSAMVERDKYMNR